MLSIAQLTRLTSKDQALETLLAELTALGYAARSWHSGNVRRTMLEAFSLLYEAASGVVTDIAGAGFNDSATGGWLDVFAASHYNNLRKEAVATEGLVRLTAEANAGPYSFGPDELVFTDNTSGLSFRNVEAGALEAGATLVLTVRCDVPGAAGDLAPGALNVMRTPLAGVSAVNRVIDGQSTWITRNGSDEERDPALRERNRTKWATLAALGRPGTAYAHLALDAHNAVRRVGLDASNPRGPGTIDVYLAGDSGPVSSVVASEVDQFMHGAVDGVVRVGLGADVRFVPALRHELKLTGTVYLRGAYNTRSVQLSIVRALQAHFRALPVGGRRVRYGDQGRVQMSDLYPIVLGTPGVQNVVFTAPPGDYPLLARQVVVPRVLLSYVSV